MTKLDRLGSLLRSWRAATLGSGGVFLRDVGHGLLEVSHNSLALLGLSVVGVVLFASSRADVRHALEAETLSWLQARQEARAQAPTGAEEPDLGEPDAIARATASDPKDLSRAQAAVAVWLSRRYHVAPEPVSRLVQEAWRVGEMTQIDPTLILSVMAVESSFNPFAQSPVGAQGLMQVMTKVHDDKYEAFGGSHAAFDPVTNLRVGVQVLEGVHQARRQPRGRAAFLRRRRQQRRRRLRHQGPDRAEHPAPAGRHEAASPAGAPHHGSAGR